MYSNVYCVLAKNWVPLPSSIVADEALSRTLSLLSAKMSHLGGIPPCSAGIGYLGVPPTVRPLAECQVRSRRPCVPLLSGAAGTTAGDMPLVHGGSEAPWEVLGKNTLFHKDIQEALWFSILQLFITQVMMLKRYCLISGWTYICSNTCFESLVVLTEKSKRTHLASSLLSSRASTGSWGNAR